MSLSFKHFSLFGGFGYSTKVWEERTDGQCPMLQRQESNRHMLEMISYLTYVCHTHTLGWGEQLSLLYYLYAHCLFCRNWKQKRLGPEVVRAPTICSFLICLLSLPGTISCQKCVTSSSPAHFMKHLIWIKLKLLPHQSLHTPHNPCSFPRIAVT